MNTLRGLGACAVLAGIAYAVTKVTDINLLVLVITITTVAVSAITYLLSMKRRRNDRRAANGRVRSRRAAS
jgi:hypothetical protein